MYAGYLGVFTLRTDTKAARGSLLQRRVGGRWRTVDKGPGFERDALIAALPAGRQRLRAVLVFDGSMVTVAERTVAVLRGGRRVTSQRDDGSYIARRSDPNKGALDFRVARGGRVLRRFRASVLAFCVGPTPGENMFIRSFADLDSVRVAPDGSVVGRLERKGSPARVTLIARLRGRRLTGTVSLSFSSCKGDRKLHAVRRG